MIYYITLHMTPNGTRLMHDWEKMAAEPVRFQRDYWQIVQLFSEICKPKAPDDVSLFKVKISFKVQNHRYYRLGIDYEAKAGCSANIRKAGLQMYETLCQQFLSQ